MTNCLHEGNRCWSCMLGNCYDQPTEHLWWDMDDVDDAAEQNLPLPKGNCNCAFCGEPALRKSD